MYILLYNIFCHIQKQSGVISRLFKKKDKNKSKEKKRDQIKSVSDNRSSEAGGDLTSSVSMPNIAEAGLNQCCISN